MKLISPQLFNKLKERSTFLVLGWRIERTDGFVLGFTSGDVPFEIDGVQYEPSNAFSGMALSSKANLSVDNTSATVLTSEQITETDLLAGRWDNAVVRMFWTDPFEPGATIQLRGGKLGEVKVRNGQFECELRSLFQKLQQPFGRFYSLECSADLGDDLCKVWLEAGAWQANKRYIAKAGADAGIGSYVRPSSQTGYWYQCVRAQGSQASVTSNSVYLPAVAASIIEISPFANYSAQAANIKLMEAIADIDDGTIVVDETSDPWLKALASAMRGNDNGKVTVEGATPYGESFYQTNVTSQGQLVNSAAYLTPTKEGEVPNSAPAGVQPLTITNLSSTIRYALGMSGTSEPAWPTTLGAEVTDNHLVWRCIRARRLRGAVTAVFSRGHFTDKTRQEPANWWRYGTLQWLTGANAGLKVEVSSYDQDNGGAFALLEQMPNRVMSGDQYEVVKGCAKTRTACKELDNIHNFRGFPDLPTEEKALATANITSRPGRKKQDSGGS